MKIIETERQNQDVLSRVASFGNSYFSLLFVSEQINDYCRIVVIDLDVESADYMPIWEEITQFV